MHLTGSNQGERLYIYRVIKEFATTDGVIWPVGASRLWTDDEVMKFKEKIKPNGFVFEHLMEHVDVWM